MKYLSFDIECCDGKHICEFGYVLIDENFNVLDRNCPTINPNHKFKLAGRAHESDISLAFSEDVYVNSPTFDFYYDRIKKLLTTPNCQIVGFSLANDAKFLATASKISKQVWTFAIFCGIVLCYRRWQILWILSKSYGTATSLRSSNARGEISR